MTELSTELLCSIVLADGNQMDKGLEGLDNLAKSTNNPGGNLMYMRDCSREWFCLELLKKMIARMISKASTNQTHDWPTN